MTKYQIIAERVAITFAESAAAYLIVIPTVNWNKTVIAGAIGAGLSAVYNLLREAQPTITPVEQTPVVISPDPVVEEPVANLPIGT